MLCRHTFTFLNTEYEPGLELYGANPLRAMVCCQNGSLGPAVPAPNGAEQEVPRAVASDARKEIARKEASLILEKSMPNGRSHTEG
jgi:hypothetical protein